jgi:hypothetical protein
MGSASGEGRTRGKLFPVCMKEPIPNHPMCRVIDLFVNRLDGAVLGVERAEAAEIGRPNDPTMIRAAC